MALSAALLKCADMHTSAGVLPEWGPVCLGELKKYSSEATPLEEQEDSFSFEEWLDEMSGSAFTPVFCDSDDLSTPFTSQTSDNTFNDFQ